MISKEDKTFDRPSKSSKVSDNSVCSNKRFSSISVGRAELKHCYWLLGKIQNTLTEEEKILHINLNGNIYNDKDINRN